MGEFTGLGGVWAQTTDKAIMMPSGQKIDIWL
jgi:hypothetical protein